MSRVIAATDNSVAARPVVAAAEALGQILGATVEAIHVADAEDDDVTARTAAERAHVAYRLLNGDAAARLLEEGKRDDVAAVVLGARRLPTDARALGGTAAALSTRLLKPVLVVPSDARVHDNFRRVLVPLEGSHASSLAPRSLIELAAEARIDVVALHVLDADTIPAFTDQPQHEQPVWAREFLARYCPWGIDTVELHMRVGETAALVPEVALDCGCDLIALGWAQELEAGRAPVVRAALTRSRVPVLLVPVRLVERVAVPERARPHTGRPSVRPRPRQGS